MQAQETYKIAHTARCKLHIAADRPDRNLRFILGHAFTLDKLMLRIAEIEVDSSSGSEEDDDLPTVAGDRRVSFSGRTKAANSGTGRNRSPPPPPQLADSGDSSSSSSSDEEVEDDEEDEGLGLTRFGSAAAQPPRREGRDSKPSILSEEELKGITEGEDNEELAELYQHVAGCPCHREKGVPVQKVWEVPSLEKGGPRMAVVQVSA